VHDLMVAAVEYRFGQVNRLPVTIEWLSDNGSLPKATFVTRLQPLRLPARAARQLPDQSTTLRVASERRANLEKDDAQADPIGFSGKADTSDLYLIV
jgi:putative transposase